LDLLIEMKETQAYLTHQKML